MRATWYFDFISPFAYLQLGKILSLNERLPVEPVPILFAGVLDALGQRGPAEIPGKRLFTYRLVQWQAAQAGIPLRFPPTHPFNPLPALRLCIAAGGAWDVVRTIFAHLWRDGCAGDSPEALTRLAASLIPGDTTVALAQQSVKDVLRRNTQRALDAQVFGVPTLQVDGTLFWGNDASAMALDYVNNTALFTSEDYRYLEQLPVGIARNRG
ncbi:MAG: 2-hydroxychromene-2-carboxylate isomerase [Tahibacter sp.]